MGRGDSGNCVAGGPAWAGWLALLLYKAPSPLSQPSTPCRAQKRDPGCSHEVPPACPGPGPCLWHPGHHRHPDHEGPGHPEGSRVAGWVVSCRVGRGAGPQRPREAVTSGVPISQLGPPAKSPAGAASTRCLVSCILEAGSPQSGCRPGCLLLRLLSGEQTAVFSLRPLCALISSSCEVTRPAGSTPAHTASRDLCHLVKGRVSSHVLRFWGLMGHSSAPKRVTLPLKFSPPPAMSPQDPNIAMCAGAHLGPSLGSE